MKTMLSSDTVFARPLCRYATQYGPVTVFRDEQVRTFCVIRSDLTGQILGICLAIRPAENLVRERIDDVATPADNMTCFRLRNRPLLTQEEVDATY